MIKLEIIDRNSSLDGLEVLNSIAVDKDTYGEAPVVDVINEELYKEFLKMSEEEVSSDNPCFRYWIISDDKKIGYADIKDSMDEDTISKEGNIGIIILKKYRNKGIGKEVMPMLLDKAFNEHNLKDVIISTDEKNTSMRRLCEDMGGKLTDMDGKCHYWFKSMKKTL